MKDRNSLLLATRAEFERVYLEAFDIFRPKCIEDAFHQADTTHSSVEQHHLLTARGILMERHTILRQNLLAAMAHLLNRSLQTTYSHDRPIFQKNTNALSLVDTADFEDELQLGAFTDQFRKEAEEQLRDLNIRIALLFGQDDIKERENPFRPYLISRSLADATGMLAVPLDIGHRLTILMADGMATQVDGIYASVNAFMSQHGVAAELPLKIRKSPNATAPLPLNEDAGFADEGTATSSPVPPQAAPGTTPQFANMPRQSGQVAQGSGAAQGIDQFLQNIQSMVANAGTQAVGAMADAVAQNVVGEQSNGSPEPASQAPNGVTQASDEARIDKLLAMMQQYSQQTATPGALTSPAATASAATAANTQPPAMMTRIMDNLRALATGGVMGASAAQAGSGASAGAAASFQSDNAGGAAAAQSTSGATGWMGGVQKVGAALKQFFTSGTSNPHANSMGAGPRIVTVQLAQSVDDLLHTQTPSTEDMTNSEGRIRNLLLEQRAALTEQTEVVDEQMTIDVVAMLFEFILQDHRVPAEVRAQLGRLQFLVLKMALRDPTLLTQKGHPVRLLINRIGSISVGLKKIDPSSERVSNEICHIVESLLDNATQNPTEFSAYFARMLDDFDVFVAAELRKNDEQVNQAVAAIEDIKNRTLRFAHISAQMAEILSGVKLDTYFYEFLSNTWVQVIERAETVDMARATRYRALVPDLVWSIAPKIDVYDREELAAILPIMINTLRDGLSMIAWPADKQREMIDWLFDAHGRALRITVDTDTFQVPSLPNMHTNFESLVSNAVVKTVPPTASELRAAEKVLTDAAALVPNAAIATVNQFAEHELLAELNLDDIEGVDFGTDAVDAYEDESVSERLYNGINIEIKLSVRPTRAKLSWVSEDAGNLLLTLDDAKLPMVMSVKAFRRLYNHGRVHFLEDEMLFERAVKSLLDAAEHMDANEVE
ncbi:DUF1631 family protein [Sulfuriferula nivalis]|uniref:Thymidine phosphorylase n=1 Tax=Sulfuriferula nivalis TaxID=2675298 RepID=A0A809S3Q1_9PROT|nr:DUF1631 family protein [Sulfuriferula nivalis]BBP01438.1 hypothetical protein SFSGTM_21460 [Sulfuriferula nivalis]